MVIIKLFQPSSLFHISFSRRFAPASTQIFAHWILSQFLLLQDLDQHKAQWVATSTTVKYNLQKNELNTPVEEEVIWRNKLQRSNYFLSACDRISSGWYLCQRFRLLFHFKRLSKKKPKTTKWITGSLERWSTLGPGCLCTFLPRAPYCKTYAFPDTEWFP